MSARYCTTIRPFRIPEGETSPESCKPDDADGWEAFCEEDRRYFYRTKREACAASEALEIGAEPQGGLPFWPRHHFIA